MKVKKCWSAFNQKIKSLTNQLKETFSFRQGNMPKQEACFSWRFLQEKAMRWLNLAKHNPFQSLRWKFYFPCNQITILASDYTAVCITLNLANVSERTTAIKLTQSWEPDNAVTICCWESNRAYSNWSCLLGFTSCLVDDGELGGNLQWLNRHKMFGFFLNPSNWAVSCGCHSFTYILNLFSVFIFFFYYSWNH